MITRHYKSTAKDHQEERQEKGDGLNFCFFGNIKRQARMRAAGEEWGMYLQTRFPWSTVLKYGTGAFTIAFGCPVIGSGTRALLVVLTRKFLLGTRCLSLSLQFFCPPCCSLSNHADVLLQISKSHWCWALSAGNCLWNVNWKIFLLMRFRSLSFFLS